MSRLFMNLFLGFLFMFIIAFLWIRWQERSGLFFPAQDLYASPAAEGVPFEDVHFDSAGNRLHGWYMPASGDHVVLWAHGNAGNIADRLDQAVHMKRSLGVSSFMFDYRGYGKSEGRPSEKGLYQDTEAAFKWLTETRGIDPGRIILYGHSLGSAAAVDLALNAGSVAGGIVLESPFTSAAEVAKRIYFGLPVGLVMSVKLDNIGRVGDVRMPILVIHGDRDTVIPFDMGKRIFEAAPEPKAFLPVAGGDHSDCYIVGGARYWEAWKKLLEKSGARSRESGEVQKQ